MGRMRADGIAEDVPEKGDLNCGREDRVRTQAVLSSRIRFAAIPRLAFLRTRLDMDFHCQLGTPQGAPARLPIGAWLGDFHCAAAAPVGQSTPYLAADRARKEPQLPITGSALQRPEDGGGVGGQCQRTSAICFALHSRRLTLRPLVAKVADVAVARRRGPLLRWVWAQERTPRRPRVEPSLPSRRAAPRSAAPAWVALDEPPTLCGITASSAAAPQPHAGPRLGNGPTLTARATPPSGPPPDRLSAG